MYRKSKHWARHSVDEVVPTWLFTKLFFAPPPDFSLFWGGGGRRGSEGV